MSEQAGASRGRSRKPNDSFETQYNELREAVKRLEQDDLTLDESLDEFEKGLKMLKSCYGYIEEAERRIELLTRKENGERERQKFEHEAWAPREKDSLFD